MAHFAQLNDDNEVVTVVVVANSELLDENENEQESLGITFCNRLFGGTWKQTSYNNTFRKNFAGVGYVFDSSRNAFIPPKPYASWLLNETTCQWEAPIAMPVDEYFYAWNEDKRSWDQFDTPM